MSLEVIMILLIFFINQNGLCNLFVSSLTSCHGGFGSQRLCNVNSNSKNRRNLLDGKLTYVVPKGSVTRRDDYADIVVDNLATMLTSGRLSNYHKDITKQVYLSGSNDLESLKLAQQLILLSPEFHQTGLVEEAGERRPFMPPATKVCKEYKAVVHILLKGGCDSFNLLVPHSQCRGKG